MPPYRGGSYTSRRSGPSGLAALVGGFLEGKRETDDRAREGREAEQKATDAAAARRRADADDARRQAEDSRRQQDFETDQDERGYTRERASGLSDAGAAERDRRSSLGADVGSALLGDDSKSWRKTKPSTTERAAGDRQAREIAVAGARAESAQELEAQRQRGRETLEGERAQHARELQAERDRNRADLTRTSILLRGAGGGRYNNPNAVTPREREINRAEKNHTFQQGRMDKHIARRPKPGDFEDGFGDVDPKAQARAEGTWRSDSAAIARPLEASERRLGDLLNLPGDDVPPPAAAAPAAPAAPAGPRPGAQAISPAAKAGYDRLAQQYQAALQRISDPAKRAAAKQRYEAEVARIARTGGAS
jgi:hypothetical protein